MDGNIEVSYNCFTINGGWVVKKKVGVSISLNKCIEKYKVFYIMLIPGILYMLVFNYLPMFGLIVAFQDYQPYLGFSKSPFVGFQHFSRLFSEPTFGMLLKNTLILGLMNIGLFFPVPIILSLLMNELKSNRFKRIVQTSIYIPHFVSWVIIAGITYELLTTEGGLVNEALFAIGLPKVSFLSSEVAFRPMVLLQSIWKEAGWGTIIFLAAISGINPELYAAAVVDGASRWEQLLHITLPSIMGIIVTLLILRLGSFLNTGFEQLLLMMNALNRSVAEVFDTYVYTTGIVGGQFSYTAAVGFFKSVVSCILVFSAIHINRRINDAELFY